MAKKIKEEGKEEKKFSLKSTAFKDGEHIPEKHTCDGDDVNPLLEISNAPEGTKSFVLLVDDLDVPGGRIWDHWVLWNIDPRTRYIPEDGVPHGAIQGTTSFHEKKYGGPCPPEGDKAHRYRFRLFALSNALDLPEGSKRTEVEKVLSKEIVLGSATLMGLYKRR